MKSYLCLTPLIDNSLKLINITSLSWEMTRGYIRSPHFNSMNRRMNACVRVATPPPSSLPWLSDLSLVKICPKMP